MTNAAASVLEVERDGDRLTLTLNRPGSANALSPDLVERLIERLERPGDLRLCVLRGAGKHFCAGFDLSDLESISDGDLLWRFLRIEHLLQLVYHAPFPVMALAQGQVVGAGADLFAACWRRIATAEAKFRMPGWNFELALGTRRLTHLIGREAARDLLIDTKTLPAAQALACGLVSEIVEADRWPALVAASLTRTRALPAKALADMLEITTQDTRSEDIAAIVTTAGRPGLKQRVMAYRDQVLAKKKG
ncbi:MAG: enoyl-CoA hydratase/isomerase family protein [Pseudomonadota bacterium]